MRRLLLLMLLATPAAAQTAEPDWAGKAERLFYLRGTARVELRQGDTLLAEVRERVSVDPRSDRRYTAGVWKTRYSRMKLLGTKRAVTVKMVEDEKNWVAIFRVEDFLGRNWSLTAALGGKDAPVTASEKVELDRESARGFASWTDLAKTGSGPLTAVMTLELAFPKGRRAPVPVTPEETRPRYAKVIPVHAKGLITATVRDGGKVVGTQTRTLELTARKDAHERLVSTMALRYSARIPAGRQRFEAPLRIADDATMTLTLRGFAAKDLELAGALPTDEGDWSLRAEQLQLGSTDRALLARHFPRLRKQMELDAPSVTLEAVVMSDAVAEIAWNKLKADDANEARAEKAARAEEAKLAAAARSRSRGRPRTRSTPRTPPKQAKSVGFGAVMAWLFFYIAPFLLCAALVFYVKRDEVGVGFAAVLAAPVVGLAFVPLPGFWRYAALVAYTGSVIRFDWSIFVSTTRSTGKLIR